MNLLSIAWKNLRIRPLNTFLSVVLLAFGVGIISLLLLVEKQLSEQFNRNIKDIDMVLGYKGSPMQLILANVYHVDAPTGNIKVSDAQRIIRNPMVKKAIPLAYGDNYEKFRIVGTTFDYPRHYGVELADGHSFEKPFQVVLGANVVDSNSVIRLRAPTAWCRKTMPKKKAIRTIRNSVWWASTSAAARR
jgi:putative ABC transport system permease protein